MMRWADAPGKPSPPPTATAKPGFTDELIDTSGRNLDSVAHIRGDLKIPATGEVLATNVTPKEAHARLVEWYKGKKNGGRC